ncbi:MAG: glycosyltransferase family protein, partial [Bacteroidota bacterium]
SAWACRIKRKACIALSHQAAFLSNKTPRPEKPDLFTEWIFKYYSPSSSAYGFHFKPYDNSIYTPVIRKDIRALNPSDKNFYIVYLPAYGDELLMNYFHQFSDVLIKIFSIHCKKKYTLKNVEVIPVNPQDFNQGFESCSGIITGGGFETPAEAIYLNKKMMVIPMRNQYEQICNAEALRQIGFPVLPAINKDFTLHLEKWFSNDFRYHEYYPDQTKEILMNIIEEHDPRYSGARQLQSG